MKIAYLFFPNNSVRGNLETTTSNGTSNLLIEIFHGWEKEFVQEFFFTRQM